MGRLPRSQVRHEARNTDEQADRSAERQLEPRVERRARIDHRQDARCQCQRVERIGPVVRRLRRQQYDRDHEGARHRRLGRHHLRVRQQRQSDDDGRDPSYQAGDAQCEQEQRRQDGDVPSRDRDHVVRAAPLQPVCHLRIQTGAIPNQDRGHDGGRLRVVHPHRRIHRAAHDGPHPRAPFLDPRPRSDHLDEQCALGRPDQMNAARVELIQPIRRARIGEAGRLPEGDRRPDQPSAPPLGDVIGQQGAADARPDDAVQRLPPSGAADARHGDRQAPAVRRRRRILQQPPLDDRHSRPLPAPPRSRIEPLEERRAQLAPRAKPRRDAGEHRAGQHRSRRRARRTTDPEAPGRNRAARHGGRQPQPARRDGRGCRDRRACNERDGQRHRGTHHPPRNCKIRATRPVLQAGRGFSADGVLQGVEERQDRQESAARGVGGGRDAGVVVLQRPDR